MGLFFYILLDFSKLFELVDGLVGYFRLIVDLFVVDHFIHIVGGNWSDDVFVFFVVPHCFFFVEVTFIELVEACEGSRFVVLFLFLGLFFIVGFADEDDCFVFACFFLEVFGFDVDVIGLPDVFVEVFGFLGVLAEEVI